MRNRYLVPLVFFTGLMVITAATLMKSSDVPLTYKEELGKKIFFDKISTPDWMSCASCHGPEVGFTGPNPGINKKGGVYRGAVPQRFGNRKPPSAAYATFSPIFHFDAGEGLFVGGNFWDGRATGEHLGNPAADQALGPFLNPVEQNNPSKRAVLEQIAGSKYAYLWEEVWGEPLSYGTPAEIEMNYDRVGLAIAEYEASSEVNPFSSKFDYYLKGMAELTEEEAFGLELFNGKAKCKRCHTSGGSAPLFTDNTFDNVGAPKNLDNPFYDMDEVYLDNGDPINPDGDAWIDKGLGGFLETHPNPYWAGMAAENMGKHRVPTLRNVGKAPSKNYTKAFLHNGVLKSLEEVVHFYNTRDVEDWPEPEVAENVNTDELGDLGLTPSEEAAIVAFMHTLSDGYDPGAKKQAEVKEGRTAVLDVIGPNPFNPTTEFVFDLQEAAEVSLDVFNITGRQVATLAQGYREAGAHLVSFTASHLPSGVYLVRLLTPTEVATIQVVLLK